MKDELKGQNNRDMLFGGGFKTKSEQKKSLKMKNAASSQTRKECFFSILNTNSFRGK